MPPTKRPASEVAEKEDAATKRLELDTKNAEALVPEAAIHDAADEELDASGIPVGWCECPRMGKPVWRLIPMKVPLGPEFDKHIEPEDRFTVQDAMKMAHDMLKGVPVRVPDPESAEGFKEMPAECSMVIDLTNSSRYYRRETFEDAKFKHVKIPNRGRGEAPAPQAVNDFVFSVQEYLHTHPAGYILVHCTHGFNRTGYMIVSYALRMLADAKTTVERALAAFAAARPPGIYKQYYVDHLFRYYHQKPPHNFPPVKLPEWKRGSSPDRGDDGAEEPIGWGAVGEHLQHDDPIGEGVSLSEAIWVRGILMEYFLGMGDCDPGSMVFPGSQPVSLARSNLELLEQMRYWVTWKADGTRYLMLLHRAGTYLIDRSNRVTRVQMRWPTPLPGPASGAPVGPPHAGTILDGEMIVDEDIVSGKRTRRFLAYDLVAVNGANLSQLPWHERWKAIDEYVEQPRRLEQKLIGEGRWKTGYDYNAEPFRFRRKHFWPLPAARKVIHDFIPHQVSHEADGLILQPHDDPYVPLTCEELLKWKFAHMNSVDFKLKVERAGEGDAPRLVLQLLRPKGRSQFAIVDLDDATVVFPQGETPEAYDGRIIECSFDKDLQAWSFMRERKDKAYPNAEPVYRKVVASIQDDIREEELLARIDVVMKLPLYDEDLKEGH